MIKLREEGRSTKPFATLEQEVFVNAQRTADWLMRDLEEVLKDAHLSPTQYNVLRILRSAGTAGMACHEIGQRMITRDPDMTRLLDRLEDRELIGRSRERQDRRVIRVRISTEGLKLLKELDDPVRSTHRKQLSHLGEKRMRLLVRLLETARQRPARDE
jgi:DNA-binding MarR family transcriptional regulator